MNKYLPIWLVFLRELLSNPKRIGAACPSSKHLATYVAAQLPLNLRGYVIELGPGTGVLTHALLKRGILPEQLVLIESSPALADLLRTIFPQLTIYQADATNIDTLLYDNADKISAVVSSLPLKSLSKNTVGTIFRQLNNLLSRGGLFIQYTYNLLHDPLSIPSLFTLRSSKIIWLNFPPARVTTLEHR